MTVEDGHIVFHKHVYSSVVTAWKGGIIVNLTYCLLLIKEMRLVAVDGRLRSLVRGKRRLGLNK